MFDREIVAQNFPQITKTAKTTKLRRTDAESLIAGVDEVGRGPLAGPVVAAAVIVRLPFDRDQFEAFLRVLSDLDITDSKKLSRARRLKILEQLEIDCSDLWHQWDKKAPLFLNRNIANIECQFILTFKDQEYIDQFNILQSALTAMGEALTVGLEIPKAVAPLALIDGNKIPKIAQELGWKCLPIIKGDQKSLLIGLASIFAKEMRDFWMEKIDEEFPGYGFARHSGYPTREHLEALQKLGPCSYHRRTFRGVVN